MFNICSLEGMKSLACRVYQVPWSKYSHNGQFQAINMMPLAPKSSENFCFLFCKQEEASSSIPASSFKFNTKVYESALFEMKYLNDMDCQFSWQIKPTMKLLNGSVVLITNSFGVPNEYDRSSMILSPGIQALVERWEIRLVWKSCTYQEDT